MSQVPTSLGPYSIERELGRGANGVVYLATQTELSRRCALKVLPGAYRQSEETIRRFQLEANIASKLQSPGIARVWDLGWHGNHLYYAMDYCEGPTLRERLAKSGRLPPEQARSLVETLARALSTAHSQGVLHRDLKPSNVILTSEGPKITDFGLARDEDLATSLTRTGQILGTPVYMSPEQVRGAKGLDARADVYALGVILYECLTGRLPYMGSTAHELGMAIVDGRPRAPSTFVDDLDDRLEAVCLKAMHKDREGRFAHAGELADALFELTPTKAYTPTERHPAVDSGRLASPRAATRSRASVVVGVGLLCVLLLAVGGWGLLTAKAAQRERDAKAAVAEAEQWIRAGKPPEVVSARLDEARELAEDAPEIATQAERARALLLARDALAGWRELHGEGAPAERYDALLAEASEALGQGAIPPWLEATQRDVRAARSLSAAAETLALGVTPANPAELHAALALHEGADPALRARAAELRDQLAARELLAQVQRRSREVAPFDELRPQLEEVRRLAGADATLADRASLELASLAFRRGRFALATEFGAALATRPGRLGQQARYVAAFGKIWRDDMRGLEELKRIWEDAPETPVGLNAGAVYHSYSGMNDKGEVLARRSIGIDANYVDPYISLAFCLNDQRKWADALAPLARAEAMQPDHPRVYMARAFATGNLGRIQECLQAYDRVIELTMPTPMKRALRNRMQVHAQLRRYDQVQIGANLLLDQDPRDVQAMFWRGFAHERQGDTEAAQRAWWRAREIDRRLFVETVRRMGPDYHNRVRQLLFGPGGPGAGR